MTATDELRRLLDERGAGWEDGGEGLTIIPSQDGVPRAWTVNTWPSGKDMGDCLWVENRHPLAPEQAVAAMLGRETCHLEDYEGTGIYVCSECGATAPDDFTVYYCWNCGAKVVE